MDLRTLLNGVVTATPPAHVFSLFGSTSHQIDTNERPRIFYGSIYFCAFWSSISVLDDVKTKRPWGPETAEGNIPGFVDPKNASNWGWVITTILPVFCQILRGHDGCGTPTVL